MKGTLAAFVSGLVFAVGLGLGGMTDPANVQGFLDVTGDWNPGLAFVMGGALGTFALLRALFVRKRERPVLSSEYPAPPRTRLDGRLLLGAAIFGIGWGLAGFCPGPAVVSVASGSKTAILFTASMVGGMGLFRALEIALAWMQERQKPAQQPVVDAPEP